MAYNPVMSVGDAKRALLHETPSLSVEQAKAQLFNNAPPALSVSDAKQQLLRGAPQNSLSVADAKRQLLDQATQEKLSRHTPQPAIAAVPTVAEVPVQEGTSLLSDEQADTLSGGIANTGLAVVGGAAQVVGDAVNFAPQLGNLVQGLGIAPEEYEIANTIQNKINTGEALSEGEQVYYDREVDGNMASIQDIKDRSEVISAIKLGIESVQSWQNKAKQEVAIEEVRVDAAKAADEFSQGKYIAGLGTFVKGMASMALDNPAAAVELTLSSLPQMLALQLRAVPAIASLSVSNTGAAIEEFEKEYGRKPDDSETAVALMLSTVSAGADALGAKFVLGGNKLLASTAMLAKATGLKVSKLALKNARQALATSAGKGAVKASKAVGGETITEGTQNVLDQLAATQDLSKVSGTDALTDAIIGGVAGGVLASPNIVGGVAAGTASTVRKTVNKAAGKAEEVLNKAGVGTTDKVVESAKENNKPELGMKAILDAEFGKRTLDEQDVLLEEYGAFLDEYAAGPNVDPDKLIEYKTKLNDLYKIDPAESSVSEAVDVLATKDADPVEASDAADVFVANVRNSATVSPADVKRSLGSDSSFRDNATPAEVKVVEDLDNFNDAVNVARDIDNVTDDVLKGSKDSKFVGIETHMSNATRAIRRGDKVGVEGVLTKLNSFLKSQKRKLENTGNTAKFAEQVQNEVNLIESTIQQIKTRSSGIKTKSTKVARTLENIKAEGDALKKELLKVNNEYFAGDKSLESEGKFKQERADLESAISALSEEFNALRKKAKPKAEAKPKAKPEVAADKPKAQTSNVTMRDVFEFDKNGKPLKRKANFAVILSELLKGKTEQQKAGLRLEYSGVMAEIRDNQQAKLDKISITREDGDQEITFNAGQEYETLIKRMSGLKTIWTKCKQ